MYFLYRITHNITTFMHLLEEKGQNNSTAHQHNSIIIAKIPADHQIPENPMHQRLFQKN